MWKRIPHLMQQHEIQRKGHSLINLQEWIKSRRILKNKVGETLRLTDLE